MHRQYVDVLTSPNVLLPIIAHSFLIQNIRRACAFENIRNEKVGTNAQQRVR